MFENYGAKMMAFLVNRASVVHDFKKKKPSSTAFDAANVRTGVTAPLGPYLSGALSQEERLQTHARHVASI